MSTLLTDMASGDPGVVPYHDELLGRTVWVRLRRAPDERWEVCELYVPPIDRPISSDDLRRIPLARIEAAFNATTDTKTGSDQLSGVPVDYEKVTPPPAVRTWFEAGDGAPQAPQFLPVGLVLEIPVARPYPDTFYTAVARLYTELASHSHNPARLIAEANGVPLGTAHGWIKAARRRNLLGPGRRGKAG